MYKKFSFYIFVSMLIGGIFYLLWLSVGFHVKTQYIVVAGYRGKLFIKENQPGGEIVPSRNDTYIFRFSPKGTLKIMGADPTLNRSQSTSAIFSDGTPLPVESLVDAKSGVVSFFFLTTDSEGTSEFFVGTKDDLTNTYYK